jgi:transposase
LQHSWAVRHHVRMNPYSEDLRQKIDEAVERGMPKIQAAETFGVGISSVKRYVATYRKGGSLAPKKRPGSKPKLDESARKLLEANLEEHPEATLPQRREFLRRVCGVSVSDSTVSRTLGRMGWSRKKDRWARAKGTSGSEPPPRSLRWPPVLSSERCSSFRSSLLGFPCLFNNITC